MIIKYFLNDAYPLLSILVYISIESKESLKIFNLVFHFSKFRNCSVVHPCVSIQGTATDNIKIGGIEEGSINKIQTGQFKK